MKWRIAPGDKHGKPRKRISRFHRHANIEEKIGPDWGAIGEFRLRFLTDRYRSSGPRLSKETKNPSVPVSRGVIKMSPPDRRAAFENTKARSPSTRVSASVASTENEGFRPRNARTWAPFSSSKTEQVM